MMLMCPPLILSIKSITVNFEYALSSNTNCRKVYAWRLPNQLAPFIKSERNNPLERDFQISKAPFISQQPYASKSCNSIYRNVLKPKWDDAEEYIINSFYNIDKDNF